MTTKYDNMSFVSTSNDISKSCDVYLINTNDFVLWKLSDIY